MLAFKLCADNKLGWSVSFLAQMMQRPWFPKGIEKFYLSDHWTVFHFGSVHHKKAWVLKKSTGVESTHNKGKEAQWDAAGVNHRRSRMRSNRRGSLGPHWGRRQKSWFGGAWQYPSKMPSRHEGLVEKGTAGAEILGRQQARRQDMQGTRWDKTGCYLGREADTGKTRDHQAQSTKFQWHQ